MITDKELDIARGCIRTALRYGASAARVSLNKSVSEGCTLLNGELDKITHSADRSVYLYIFADDRYGTFSTNKLEGEELDGFIRNAVEMVRLLGEDRSYTLPDIGRTAKDAVTGKELGLFDEGYKDIDIHQRLEKAELLSIFSKVTAQQNEGFTLISEECEYTDTCDDTFLADSNGFEGRHTETTFSCFTEVTVSDRDGNRYSGYWWEMAPMAADLKIAGCAEKALDRAASQIGPKKRRSGRYRMVVDRTVASRLISPVINALNSTSIQQHLSFLEGSSGKRLFPEGLYLKDLARTYGRTGSRLFDTEGVATKDADIISDGVVMQYFTNTCMANKMGIEPTIEDISRPCLLPYMKGRSLSSEEKDISLKDILSFCGNGILVTGFNGGNSNPVTGDFSFGIEGFAFAAGKITHPVREMLITGNIMELWNSLVVAGSDARESSRWQIPSIAFEGVAFSG